MSEKKEKAAKAAAPASAEAVQKNEGVAAKIIGELARVHMRIPKYDGMGKK